VALVRSLMQEDASAPLSTNPLRSLRSLARTVGVDKETVRSRLQHLESVGFRIRSGVMLNPALARLQFAQVWVAGLPGSAKERWIAAARQHPSTVVVTDYVGDALNVAALKPQEQSVAAFLASLPPAKEAEWTYRELAVPPCRHELTALDRRIVDGLNQRPHASNASLAQAVGLSARTVQRRLARLVAERAIFVIPSFSPDALEATVADLTVFYDAKAAKGPADRQVRDRLADRLFRQDLHNADHSFFNLFLDNAARGPALLDWVRALPGVSSARLDLVQRRVECLDHLAPLVAARLPARPGAPRPGNTRRRRQGNP